MLLCVEWSKPKFVIIVSPLQVNEGVLVNLILLLRFLHLGNATFLGGQRRAQNPPQFLNQRRIRHRARRNRLELILIVQLHVSFRHARRLILHTRFLQQHIVIKLPPRQLHLIQHVLRRDQRLPPRLLIRLAHAFVLFLHRFAFILIVGIFVASHILEESLQAFPRGDVARIGEVGVVDGFELRLSVLVDAAGRHGPAMQAVL
mmetsp:Transcript_24956/g.53992  ORF Transcript_24956/g.53992 Transcript_24956/m.53992 type:complete len:203 (+) Transcript_24956:2642-3250(+)